MNTSKYDKINGLRAFSAIGIALMHVYTNGGYSMDGFVFERLIPSFTNLVFLFMVISGFSMCCGYYDKIIQNKITVEEFYSKRYGKIWPYFALLCVLDFILSPNLNSVYEIFANLTLCFGLLPNPDISVVGVGWFLGLVFVFYLIFPFFCYLLSDKKRAWLSFAAALLFHILCTVRFEAERNNIVCSAVFFLAGGMIFLYREQLCRLMEKHKWFVMVEIIVVAAVYYCISDSALVMLVLSSLMLIYALDNTGRTTVLNNPVTNFLSGISMEFYLSHMVVFRLIEKVGLLHLCASDLLSYSICVCLTVAGTIVFSVLAKKFLALICSMEKRALIKNRKG